MLVRHSVLRFKYANSFKAELHFGGAAARWLGTGHFSRRERWSVTASSGYSLSVVKVMKADHRKLCVTKRWYACVWAYRISVSVSCYGREIGWSVSGNIGRPA
jgi:hypothetical protein